MNRSCVKSWTRTQIRSWRKPVDNLILLVNRSGRFHLYVQVSLWSSCVSGELAFIKMNFLLGFLWLSWDCILCEDSCYARNFTNRFFRFNPQVSTGPKNYYWVKKLPLDVWPGMRFQQIFHSTSTSEIYCSFLWISHFLFKK